MHFHLATSGTVVAGAVPCCPKCGTVTARMSINERQCLNKKCAHVVDYRVAGVSGNGRVAFSVDGSDPAASLPKNRRGYTHRVLKP